MIGREKTVESLKFDYTLPRSTSTSEASGEVRSALAPGEKLLWSGQPGQSLMIFRWSDLATIPFFIFWTGFSLFWEAMALEGVMAEGPNLLSPMLCFPLWGLPFLLIGLYMLFGRFVGDYLVRRRTYYALTDRRVIIVAGMRYRSVRSALLDKLSTVDFIAHRDGRGTLVFATEGKSAQAYRYGYYSNSMGGGSSSIPAFEHIADPGSVFDMVMKAQDELMKR